MKKKVLAMSLLTIAMCASLIIGATLALFSDKAQTDLSVSSGKIDVTASIDEESLVLYSPKLINEDGVITDATNVASGTKFFNGGTVTIEDNTLALENVTPGDKATFTINMKIESNIAVKYRVQLLRGQDEGLFAGLKVSVDDKECDTSWEELYETDWIEADAGVGAEISPISVAIELPANAESKYQNTSCSLIARVEAVQGNAEIPSEEQFGDNVAYDGNKYYKTLAEAIEVINASPNGGTLYLRPNAESTLLDNAHTPVMKNLTIYANGAKFDQDLSIDTYGGPLTEDITLEVYDAKNLYVWGEAKSDITRTIKLYNCQNTGEGATQHAGRLFYISGTAGTTNVLIDNCIVQNTDSPIYTNAKGEVVVQNSEFIDCAVPININTKAEDGTLTAKVINNTFIRCGCTEEMDATISTYAAPIRFVETNKCQVTLTVDGNKVIDTVGDNGDVLLGELREGEVSYHVDATVQPDLEVNYGE